MNNFSFSKAIGYGIGLWAIMFIVGMLLVLFGVTLTAGWVFLLAILAGVIAYSFATYIDPRSTGSALGYGLTWVLVVAILNALIVTPFVAGAGLFGLWSYWLGAAFILFAPWVEMAARKSPKLSLKP